MSTQTAENSDFTPGERAYFNSRGTDVAGLEAEIAQNGQGDAPAGDQRPAGADGQPAPAAASGDPEVPGEQDAEAADGDADGEEVVIVGKDGKPRGQNGRFVPHQALHQEREKHKATRNELETMRERQARADERLAVLNEIIGKADEGAKPGAKQAPAPIDPEADPIGALQSAIAEIKRLEAEITSSKSQSQERETARAMQSAYQNDAIKYLAEKPEFKDAYRFLMEARHRELEVMGMSDVAERNRFIANEERGVVAAAFQSRRSPAQMLHNLAIARGFKAEPAPQSPKPASDPVRKIEQIAKGQQQAGASLTGAGGASGEGLTISALADMNEEEFAIVAAKLGKSKLRQLLGG